MIVIVRNNHRFLAKLPISVPIGTGSSVTGENAKGQPIAAQRSGDRVWFVPAVPARSEQTFYPDCACPGSESTLRLNIEGNLLRVSAPASSVALELRLGLIEGDETLRDNPPVGHAEWPQMSMRGQERGAVFSRWDLVGSWGGYQIDMTVRCFHAGFVDVEVGLTNRGHEKKHTYLALVKTLRLNRPATCWASRWHGRVCDTLQFDTPDHFYQGLDWVAARGDGWAAGLMNDITYNWHKPSPDGKWFLECNGRMAKHRLVESGNDACVVTFITGPRFEATKYDAMGDYGYVTPPSGKRLSYAMRLVLTAASSAEEAD